MNDYSIIFSVFRSSEFETGCAIQNLMAVNRILNDRYHALYDFVLTSVDDTEQSKQISKILDKMFDPIFSKDTNDITFKDLEQLQSIYWLLGTSQCEEYASVRNFVNERINKSTDNRFNWLLNDISDIFRACMHYDINLAISNAMTPRPKTRYNVNDNIQKVLSMLVESDIED
jgi:hypothetical protein